MTIISKKIMDDVYAALPADGSSVAPKAVHSSMGMWSPQTVRHALTQLYEEGRVTFTGANGHRQYRRAAA